MSSEIKKNFLPHCQNRRIECSSCPYSLFGLDDKRERARNRRCLLLLNTDFGSRTRSSYVLTHSWPRPGFLPHSICHTAPSPSRTWWPAAKNRIPPPASKPKPYQILAYGPRNSQARPIKSRNSYCGIPATSPDGTDHACRSWIMSRAPVADDMNAL